MALLATHPGALADYRAGGARPVTPAIAPVISIPTTAGTGSEVGRGMGITLAEGGAKAVFISVHLIPPGGDLRPRPHRQHAPMAHPPAPASMR